jgi:GNAT superfamily N-acetyltransferase
VRTSRERASLGESKLKRRNDRSIAYRVDPKVTSRELDRLFAAAWCGYEPRDWPAVLKHSLVYICAYRGRSLIGFVNVAWDGGVHGFILDTTVHPEMRRRGIGSRLVKQVASEARIRNLEWLHVDFEPHLRGFYDGCGFRPTEAGLLHLGTR